MAHRSWLLEQALDDIAAQRRSVDECIEYYASDDSELAEMLRLATSLRDACPPAVDATAMQRARARVRSRLLAAMEYDERAAQTTVTAGAGSRIVSLADWRRRKRHEALPYWTRVACALAAALLLCISSGWLVTNAAQGALPESPLYAVKRGEEWVLQRTAWSDSRQGEVLASIAAHRLSEAMTEAALHHDATAHALIAELDTDMSKLIVLTASMSARHEDASAVKTMLISDLSAEYSAMQSARSAGLSAFAQDLGTMTRSQMADIQKDQLHVSTPGGTPPATPGGNTSTGHGASATPPGQTGTHGGQGVVGSGAQTGGGGSGGNGGGRGNGGNGGSGGKGASHVTPTPSPTATPPGHSSGTRHVNSSGGAKPAGSSDHVESADDSVRGNRSKRVSMSVTTSTSRQGNPPARKSAADH